MTATTFEVERTGSAGVIRVGGDVTAASETGLMDAYQRASEGGASGRSCWTSPPSST